MKKPKIVKARRKTREATGADFVCPVHGCTIKHTVKFKPDEDGDTRYAGEYYKCPFYFSGGCRYYMQLPKDGRPARVPVME